MPLETRRSGCLGRSRCEVGQRSFSPTPAAYRPVGTRAWTLSVTRFHRLVPRVRGRQQHDISPLPIGAATLVLLRSTPRRPTRDVHRNCGQPCGKVSNNPLQRAALVGEFSDLHHGGATRRVDWPDVPRRQDLDRHVAVQGRVVGAKDLAHATRADLGGDFVDAERGAGCESHVENGQVYRRGRRGVLLARRVPLESRRSGDLGRSRGWARKGSCSVAANAYCPVGTRAWSSSNQFWTTWICVKPANGSAARQAQGGC